MGVGGLLPEPLDLSEELRVSSDSELSPSENRDNRGEVTVLDHFTFLGEVSKLEFSPLFEPRKDDTCELTEVSDPTCSSSVGREFPQ